MTPKDKRQSVRAGSWPKNNRSRGSAARRVAPGCHVADPSGCDSAPIRKPIGAHQCTGRQSYAEAAALLGVAITLPIKTVSESNQREHWAKKARRVKTHRYTARMMCPHVKPPVIVTLTRIAPRKLDDDNLRGALKAVRDGIADRLGVPDNDPRIEWRYWQQNGASAVLVQIEQAHLDGKV